MDRGSIIKGTEIVIGDVKSVSIEIWLREERQNNHLSSNMKIRTRTTHNFLLHNNEQQHGDEGAVVSDISEWIPSGYPAIRDGLVHQTRQHRVVGPTRRIDVSTVLDL